MKILVIGSGGREHALVWKLAQSAHISKMWCAPGNAGVAGERLSKNQASVECVQIGAEDLPNLSAFAAEKGVDLTVVGPDNPLALGIVDHFQAHGLRIWGPNKKAAQFEASKAFAQSFMERHGIPTARSAVFAEPTAAKQFARSLRGRCAVKADGLALGKGVLLTGNVAEAEKAVDAVLVEKVFGAAGSRVVIQEFLEGTEVSLHAICDGQTVIPFPTSQDHKRALDGDTGLNTGGMGAISPASFLSDSRAKEIARCVLDPWQKGCVAEGIDFRGIIYPGLMLTKEGPKVLEFNARFGDPETQVYLTRLESDLLEVLEASIDGKLNRTQLQWRPEVAACVVLASAGYPGPSAKGIPIYGLDDVANLSNTKVFHAGTTNSHQQVVTNGGRVLGVTAWGRDLERARAQAYAAVEKIRFDGAHFRRDIGAKALR
jgi:phosphoribosylamine--glycine ligase